MRRLLSTGFALLVSSSLLAQKLPYGSYQTNRERSFDLIHLRGSISVDWNTKEIHGTADLTLRPLELTSAITLDAYRFNVTSVHQAHTGLALSFESGERSLRVDLEKSYTSADTVAISVRYSARPTAGLYFVPPSAGTNDRHAVFTYGEGGIHANWLPLYNDVNDKFTTEMICTVEKPYVAVSNGSLIGTEDNADGTRSFHWKQNLPHSNYLIALFVGEYVQVPLHPAFGSVPLSVWVHPGQEKVAQEVFHRTPDMVEYFSDRFSFRYPWDKYDQIVAFDYAIGAMENTSITGHNDRILRASGQLEEFNPDFETSYANWTAESIISHELAHHWFGNTLTCRNLSNLWLNESFASYLMMLWEEHRRGDDELRSHTWRALQDYLTYVETSHIIRPLEYHYFDTRAQIYNTQTTYQKGAIVLNMLRWVVGDSAFFKGLSYYLHKHAFRNVESVDLMVAFEESAGRNLKWFFDDWVWGAGHPILEVSSVYREDRKHVEVTIRQVQPIVEGQDLFKLPVEIRVDAGGSERSHRVWIEEEQTTFIFHASSNPDMVSVDGNGRLVADIRHQKSPSELAYQVRNDGLHGRLRALRSLFVQHAGHPTTIAIARDVLSGNGPWVLRADAAELLRTVESAEAEDLLLGLLKSTEDRVRKSAVVSLGWRHTDAARAALRRAVAREQNDDIAAAGLVALAKVDRNLDQSFLAGQLGQKSWYDVKKVAALRAMEIIGSPSFATIAKRYADVAYNYAVRSQALKTWAGCAPLDTELREKVLPAFAESDILDVRFTAMDLLARLKVASAVPLLRVLSEKHGDGDVRVAASATLKSIEQTQE